MRLCPKRVNPRARRVGDIPHSYLEIFSYLLQVRYTSISSNAPLFCRERRYTFYYPVWQDPAPLLQTCKTINVRMRDVMIKKKKGTLTKLLIAPARDLPNELIEHAVEALGMAHGFNKHWHREVEPGLKEIVLKEPVRYFTRRMSADVASLAQQNLRKFMKDMVIRLRHTQDLEVLVLADMHPEDSSDVIPNISVRDKNFGRLPIPFKVTVLVPPNMDTKVRAIIDQRVTHWAVLNKSSNCVCFSSREARAEELDVIELERSVHAVSLS
ncbi:hypothetical protein K491DRAFT_327370 [Lophiostoma macrostomum CBS 122681]|uniref:Uncharacterized protein n=1 Tax=Lophiostoma macrostomum CBS 122681 TaxID=1314788 RepID=A0A6A6TD91_9PLEO|nr:hypothetical protein K491DRAFT_327370 [Lophiostoma macrostomum CBS 122681]